MTKRYQVLSSIASFSQVRPLLRRNSSVPLLALLLALLAVDNLFAQNRYATSDSMAGYVHWIDLYDESNNKIDSNENSRPYSPEKTCGRCHDFKTIAHGFHFNAALPTANSDVGRPGLPLIWNDPRTGTNLPVSFRGWPGTHKPQDLGLSNWQMSAKFGGYMPGLTAPTGEAAQAPTGSIDRTKITGNLPIDCMLCHNRPGSGYSPFVWTEQIQDQNFAYAPTAALGLGVVTGNMRRLKDDVDLNSDEVKEQLPKLKYELEKFRSDGKVFIDLVRKPANESCYYCHTSASSNSPQGTRWQHDDDIHLRAGLKCSDCHRNGLDHQTVRGFEGEKHVSGTFAASLSCQGCHIGDDNSKSVGRLGAPKPAHKGLPPLHFEKLSCTACHSGPQLNDEIGRQILSSAHHLGDHIKRTGNELPAIYGNVMLPVNETGSPVDGDSGKYTPHRMMWPSFWGVVRDGKLQPLNPEQAYELVRKPLKIRKDFVDELSEVKLTLSQRKQILGDDKAARMKTEELDEKQRKLIEEAEAGERKKQIDDRMIAALKEIETAMPGSQAVYVSAGQGIVKTDDGKLSNLPEEKLGTLADPYAWPSAHMVRPAQQSLGATGCQECHGKDSQFFFAKLKPIGTLPGQETNEITVHELQKADIQRLAQWSQMFEGRSAFKIASLIAFALTCVITVSALAVNLSSSWRKSTR
ncbi:MAG: hypothetical protein U0930_16870 [Pirellulales bacterium]